MLSCNLWPSDSRCSSFVCLVVDSVLRLSVDSVDTCYNLFLFSFTNIIVWMVGIHPVD